MGHVVLVSRFPHVVDQLDQTPSYLFSMRVFIVNATLGSDVVEIWQQKKVLLPIYVLEP